MHEISIGWGHGGGARACPPAIGRGMRSTAKQCEGGSRAIPRIRNITTYEKVLYCAHYSETEDSSLVGLGRSVGWTTLELADGYVFDGLAVGFFCFLH